MFVTRPDGCRLWVEVHGREGDPPLLLLEGMGGDLPGWRRNIPRLAASLRVIAYDHRGNGMSDEPPAPCTVSTFVEDALAVLDAAGERDAHVYGQSFGGMVAQELALTHPERVRSLILAATHAGHDHIVTGETFTAPKDEPWRSLYSPGFPEAHPEHVAEDLRAGVGLPEHPEGPRAQWEAIRSWSSYERLPAIGVATLVLHGTADRLIAPGNARVLASQIPGAELVWMEGAGHVYHSEQPEAADGAVLGFIERHRDG